MTDYSYFEKLIHRLILNDTWLNRQVYELDKAFFPTNTTIQNNHVFIAGVPRAGSTALLNMIYMTGQFCSLTYKDMPFVLGKNLLKRFIPQKRQTASKERAHEDGLKIELDSPEAFDEIFWQVILNREYFDEKTIYSHYVSNKQIQEFVEYISSICVSNNKIRYLSKNNTNIFRLESLAKNMNGCFFIIPFRDPFSQALSLQEQHKRLKNSSEFENEYLKLLGHFEFGKFAKIYSLLEENSFDYESLNKDKEIYWLNLWYQSYQFLYDRLFTLPNVIFWDYNKMDQNSSISKLSEKLQVELNNSTINISKRNVIQTNKCGIKEKLVSDLYSKLQGIAL